MQDYFTRVAVEAEPRLEVLEPLVPITGTMATRLTIRLQHTS